MCGKLTSKFQTHANCKIIHFDVKDNKASRWRGSYGLDFHIIDSGLIPGPTDLKNTLGVCVCVQNIPGEW